VRHAVASRDPVDGREADSCRRCLGELDRLAAPFDRHADPIHVTGSGIVVRPGGILLLRHRRLGIWVQPGGHLEPGEAPWEAARRETGEETGLHVRLAGGPAPDLLHVDVHDAASGHTHLDLRYLLTVDGDDRPRPPAEESQDVAWYAWDEAAAIADPGLAGLIGHLRGADPA
jgi:8-oxo-dGTP pyrophosphatase MutT (NUDIX family)